MVHPSKFIHVNNTSTADKNDGGIVSTELHRVDGVLEDLFNAMASLGEGVFREVCHFARISHIGFSTGYDNICITTSQCDRSNVEAEAGSTPHQWLLEQSLQIPMLLG